MDDSVLVRLAREGDGEAFAELVARHRPMLVALCRRVLGDRGLAEDAAQEAALQAMLGLDRWNGLSGSGPGWAVSGSTSCST